MKTSDKSHLYSIFKLTNKKYAKMWIGIWPQYYSLFMINLQLMCNFYHLSQQIQFEKCVWIFVWCTFWWYWVWVINNVSYANIGYHDPKKKLDDSNVSDTHLMLCVCTGFVLVRFSSRNEKTFAFKKCVVASIWKNVCVCGWTCVSTHVVWLFSQVLTVIYLSRIPHKNNHPPHLSSTHTHTKMSDGVIKKKMFATKKKLFVNFSTR